MTRDMRQTRDRRGGARGCDVIRLIQEPQKRLLLQPGAAAAFSIADYCCLTALNSVVVLCNLSVTTT